MTRSPGYLTWLFLTVAGLLNLQLVHAETERYVTALGAYQMQLFARAESIWTDLANSGDASAQYALGIMHMRGEAIEASNSVAVSWFEKAAAQGHATALFNLGIAYWQGKIIEQDRERALNLWEQAANKGDSGAQFNLGLAYFTGEARDQDLDLAAKWIGLAAKQNHPGAIRVMELIDAKQTDQTADSANSVPDNLSTSTETSDASQIVAAPSETQQAPVDEEALKQLLISRVKSWAFAWSDRDVDRYLSHYSQNFIPRDELSLEEWKKQRYGRLRWRESIIVEPSRYKVVIEGEAARVSFLQYYKSERYEETIEKTLEFRKENDIWLIVRELI